MKLTAVFISILVLLGGFISYNYFYKSSEDNLSSPFESQEENQGGPEQKLHPLTIESLRQGEYPGSEIVIEQELDPGSNYQRYIASYKSEGLKIFALLTVPNGKPPGGGWPVVVFNHGYIPPSEYRTTERYIAYTDAFSRSDYILFRPDYRGHGNSEGSPSGAYGSNGYLIDVLNAVSSIKKYPEVNSNKIGMWGHSLGGFIILRAMVVSKDIKAGVIWAGVVGSYTDLIYNWRRGNFSPPPQLQSTVRRWRQELIDKYGTPEQNPAFWNSLSANSYLKDISGPLQLHHGTADASVPVMFSQKLEEQMKKESKEVEAYYYEGDDHNLSANLEIALQRSVDFFDRYIR